MESRARLLLQVATILHDCGKYVSFAEASESTYHIIMSSEIIGLTHQEREIVAQIVRYNTLPLDPYEEVADVLSQEEYLAWQNFRQFFVWQMRWIRVINRSLKISGSR